MEYFLKAKWQNLIMANYAIKPEILKPYLPYGTELDLHNGMGYASLVGFMFKDTKIFGLPIPFFGTFEEVNLRFYVVRKEGDLVKRGVVFINETVPNSIVAWLANKLYKEHYTAIPTQHKWQITNTTKTITYQWKTQNKWYELTANAANEKINMPDESFEAFIFEHYFGYTKVDVNSTLEYYIEHPTWQINKVKDYSIHCDFGVMYGDAFSFLNAEKPHSVMLGEGSDIAVKWKRNWIRRS
jgi:uncharacterized protein